MANLISELKNILYIIFFILNFYIIIIICDRNTTKNLLKHSLSEINQNPLMDPLTGMFYHVENTKRCGSNLKTFNIDMKPLWETKFRFQIKKLFLLVNSLNYLSFNEIEELIRKKKSIYHYFLFSKDNSFQNDVFDSDETNSQNFRLETNFDPFVHGYGLYLKKSIDQNCIFFMRNPESNDILSSSNPINIINCNAINIDSLVSLSSSMDFKIENEPSFPDSKNKENEFSSINDMFTSDSNSVYPNCKNWYTSLEKAFQTLKSRIDLNNNSHAFLLQKLNSDKNLSSSLWCGPYYECSHFQEKKINEWVLIYSLPIIDINNNLIGAVLLKLKLTKLNLNQCPNGDPIVANSHKCKANSECIYSATKKFQFGSYKCKCTSGYLNSNVSTYDGSVLENQYWLMKGDKNNSYSNSFNCIPCVENECCNFDQSSIDNTIYSKLDDEMIKEYQNRVNMFSKCRKYNMTLRYSVLFVQIIFVLTTLFLSIVVFYSRRNKVKFHKAKILKIKFCKFNSYLTHFINFQDNKAFYVDSARNNIVWGFTPISNGEKLSNYLYLYLSSIN